MYGVLLEINKIGGENDNFLQPFIISKERIQSLLVNADHPPLVNVELVINGKDSNADDESTLGDLCDISKI
jgi:hypothetical protein